MKNDIILTGPPRSGTTLACYLLNKVDNTIALHEPMSLHMFPDRMAGLNAVQRFFPEMRQSLLDSGTAISKVKDGTIPSNPFLENTSKNRSSVVQKQFIQFDKKLNPDFKLIIKHNGHFTFLLPELEELYDVYILIRHPVSTIASWNSINAPVSEGNLKVLKFLNPDFFELLNNTPDLIKRQVLLLDMMYRNYLKATKARILRYEDMISSDGRMLEVISADAAKLNEPLTSKNTNPLYSKDLVIKIKEQLLILNGHYLSFYPAEAIESY